MKNLNKNINKVKQLNKEENRLLSVPKKNGPSKQPKVKVEKLKAVKVPIKVSTLKVQPKKVKKVSKFEAAKNPQSILPTKKIGPASGGEGSYDKFFTDYNHYLQTLLRPALVFGIGIPKGDTASIKWHVSYRISAKADANGNFFFIIGAGRAVNSAATKWSAINACSLVPDNLRCPDTAGTDQTYVPCIGNMLKPTGTMSLTDVFNEVNNEILELPAEVISFADTMQATRLVSCAFSVLPTSTISGSKGTMYFGQFPSDMFDATVDLTNVTLNETFITSPGSQMLSANRLQGGTVTYKPVDDGDFMYKEHHETFAYVSEHPEVNTNSLWFAATDVEASGGFEITIHLNFESLPKSGVFAPGLTPGKDDAILLSQTVEFLNTIDDFTLEVYDQIGGGASGTSKSSNLAVHNMPMWHSLALRNSHVTTPLNSRCTEVSKKYCGKPLKASSLPNGHATTESGFKPFLKALFTDYLPVALKVATAVAPLI